jgi:HlyD family secretion protein
MKTQHLGALACVLAIAGCAQKEVVNTSAKVERRDIVGYELLQGTLVVPPSARADIGTPYQAPADKVMASVGDHVNKGEVLVQLSMPNADTALNQARTYVKTAEAAYEGAKEKLGVGVRQAARDMDAARQAEKAARDNMDPNLQQLTNARIAAEENLRATKAELDLNLVQYKQQLDDAREYLTDAQSGVKQGSIRTPITGTVIALNAQPGAVLNPVENEPVATVINLAALQVHVVMTPEQMNELKTGTEVVLAFAELEGKEFTGKISRITSLPREDDEGKTAYTAIIEFANKDAVVRPDMKLRFAGVKTGEVKDVLSVPVGALKKDPSGKPIVMVLEGEKWIPRVVEVGLTGVDSVEIKSGLKEGETVQVTTVKE